MWLQRMDASEPDPLASLDFNTLHSMIFPSEQFLLYKETNTTNNSTHSMPVVDTTVSL